ncbi:imm11 family protein [Zavarzinia aquatilis]|uniref:Immunity MXAN-0049 protein domain-containing protein n=1 Tax=Zavarzinia aquatilis TaxID=2211142 RepID=A0A317EG95_9PROT|nr:DUF1629 domain-containing protein [Zavarzinia aquatilis]PWR25316.1 hypothetical protein DKG74_06025 [Zavarzinia aquatilis]
MKKTEPCAWVSRAFMNTMLVRYVTPEGNLIDPRWNDLRWLADTMTRNQRGEALPAERFPAELYGKYSLKKINKLPDFCDALGYWVVSAAMADVLRQFDLGHTSLYPTRVYQHDRKTPVEGEYYCLNFGERKASFLADASPRANKVYPNQDIWALSLAPKNDDIALSANALEGVDLWTEEPRFTRAFFLSDRLVTALRDAKLTRYLGLFRCRIEGQ